MGALWGGMSWVGNTDSDGAVPANPAQQSGGLLAIYWLA